MFAENVFTTFTIEDIHYVKTSGNRESNGSMDSISAIVLRSPKSYKFISNLLIPGERDQFPYCDEMGWRWRKAIENHTCLKEQLPLYHMCYNDGILNPLVPEYDNTRLQLLVLKSSLERDSTFVANLTFRFYGNCDIWYKIPQSKHEVMNGLTVVGSHVCVVSPPIVKYDSDVTHHVDGRRYEVACEDRLSGLAILGAKIPDSFDIFPDNQLFQT
ncbi:hypothetical protein KC726_00680 [Candidatus Woesebacteria bacterium]|nr:hypothetical protein [Candidatus Woesebacteria bacterium]